MRSASIHARLSAWIRKSTRPILRRIGTACLIATSEFGEADELAERHRTVGQALFDKCGGELFPGDALAMTVLDRSLNLLESFRILMASHGYLCAVPVLRMQIDNIARLHGVMRSADPHTLAERVIGGEQISRMNDDAGRQMTDGSLINVLEEKNPGFKSTYQNASGYVHLSGEHTKHFLARSAPGVDGRRIFRIGHNDDHIPEENKRALEQSFARLTKGLLDLIEIWIDARTTKTSIDELRTRYTQPT